MLEINETNYDYYKSIYSIIWGYQWEFMNLNSPAHASPISLLDFWEGQSKTKAHKGLRAGLIDTISSVKYWPEVYLFETNQRLQNKNFPKIEILSAQIKDLPRKILQKGVIKNAQEYYIIKEVLSDNEYNIDVNDRLRLNQIFLNFEIKSAQK